MKPPTNLAVQYDITTHPTPTPHDALNFMYHHMTLINPDGNHTSRTTWGPIHQEHVQPHLTIHLDWQSGRAAATWHPTRQHAYETDVPPYHRNLHIFNTSRHPQNLTDTLTPLHTRLLPGTAFTLIHQYTTTGTQPTCTQWR